MAYHIIILSLYSIPRLVTGIAKHINYFQVQNISTGCIRITGCVQAPAGKRLEGMKSCNTFQIFSDSPLQHLHVYIAICV